MADRWDDREYRGRDLDYERNRGYGRSDYERDRPYDRNRGYGREEERGWLGRAVEKVKDAFTGDEERDRYPSGERDFYPDRYGREYDHDRYDRERRYGSGSTYGGGMFGNAGYRPNYGIGGGWGTGARRGGYAGRGPKGYKRSDERIGDDVCDILTRRPDVDASEISFRVENGIVTLSGTVDHRGAKRAAEDAVYDVRGVTDVRNEIRVVSGSGLTGAGTTSLTGSPGASGVGGSVTGQEKPRP